VTWRALAATLVACLGIAFGPTGQSWAAADGTWYTGGSWAGTSYSGGSKLEAGDVWRMTGNRGDGTYTVTLSNVGAWTYDANTKYWRLRVTYSATQPSGAGAYQYPAGVYLVCKDGTRTTQANAGASFVLGRTETLDWSISSSNGQPQCGGPDGWSGSWGWSIPVNGNTFPVWHDYVGAQVTWATPLAAACRVSDNAIAALWRAAGGAQAQTATAVAVAIAMSGADNGNMDKGANGEQGLGLWSINNVQHPEYVAQELLSSPLLNAQAAVAIYSADSTWAHWPAYVNGRYKRYLERAAIAASSTADGQWPTPADCDGTPADVGQDAYAGPVEGGSECTGWNPLTYMKCALQWAFVPQQSTIEAFKDNGNQLANCFPFGYVSGTFNALNLATQPRLASERADQSLGYSIELPGVIGNRAGHGSESRSVTVLQGESGPVKWLRGLRPVLEILIYLAVFGPLVMYVARRAMPVVGASQ
jgi:hypothetical protein